MKTAILLTGARGQLGCELRRALAPLAHVTAVDQAECDLANADAIRALVQRVRPQLIVNAAAYTAVDQAESTAELARAVNANAPKVLGEEAKRWGACVIHYSTDYVFDGAKAAAYVESDAPQPLNVYGASKLAGEQGLAASNPRHLILRTSWVVGAQGGNFAKSILRLAASQDQLRVVNDQVGAPTSAALLADITAHLARPLIQGGSNLFFYPFGLYHIAAGGQTHWCDYAKFVIAAAQSAGKPLKIRAEDVVAIPSSAYPQAALRPLNSRLDTTHFRQTFNLRLPPWQEGVAQVLEQIFSSQESRP